LASVGKFTLTLLTFGATASLLKFRPAYNVDKAEDQVSFCFLL
jgi:hypothetical protein